MEKKFYKCHRISEGIAEGEILISKDDIMFYLVDPLTGVMIEKDHSIEGKCVAGKILDFPSGKGSSVVQADGIYQLLAQGKAPNGMIIKNPETVLVASAIIMEIPMVDKVDPAFYKEVRNGDFIRIDADKQIISILKQK